jgi:NDP-sugar pyrophosphorylase family protein
MSRNDVPVRAVIPAAGRATRLGGVFKPLQPLGNGVILDYAIASALSAARDVTIAVPCGSRALFTQAIRRYGCVEWFECEAGMGQGATVRALLQSISPIIGPVLVVFGDDVTPVGQARRVLGPVLAGCARATQAVVWEDDPAMLREACEVTLCGRRITMVEEKPRTKSTGWRGCAVYGLSREAARDLLTIPWCSDGVMAVPYNQWISAGYPVEAVQLPWNVNVNRPGDLGRARVAVGEGGNAELGSPMRHEGPGDADTATQRGIGTEAITTGGDLL